MHLEELGSAFLMVAIGWCQAIGIYKVRQWFLFVHTKNQTSFKI